MTWLSARVCICIDTASDTVICHHLLKRLLAAQQQDTPMASIAASDEPQAGVDRPKKC